MSEQNNQLIIKDVTNVTNLDDGYTRIGVIQLKEGKDKVRDIEVPTNLITGRVTALEAVRLWPLNRRTPANFSRSLKKMLTERRADTAHL